MTGVVIDGFQLTLPAIVLGLLTGVVYGLLAVGLVLIYRTSRIVNFAQGQMGAFGAAVLGLVAVKWGVPYYIALAAALVVGGATGAVTEVVVIRRLRRAPRVMSIVATLGVGAFLSTFAQAINPSSSELPGPSGLPTFQIGALRINQGYSGMLIFGPLVVIALTIFLQRSRYGIAIRCSSANPEAARMAGISAGQMSSLAWVLAGALSALTAILVIPATGFTSSTSFGPELLLRALAAGVMARMYSMPVAFASGVGIGIVQQVLLWNYPADPNLADVVLYVIVVVALLLQHSARGREEEKGSWTAVATWPPLPKAVAQLPLVRILRWGAVFAALAIAVMLPMLVSDSSAVVLTTVIVFATIGLSVGIMTGLGGQLSLGQFAVAAIGAIVALRVEQHLPFGLALLSGAITGAVVSVLIGLPALRLRGLMLTVTTLGFALMASNWGLGQPWAFGGVVLPRPPVIFGHSLNTAKDFYYIPLALLLLTIFIGWNVRRGGVGRAMIAVRDNEDNARAFGLSAIRIKFVGFVLAGLIAGIAGAVYAFTLTVVDPTAFPAQSSIDVVVLTVLGGISTLIGPILGALYIVGLPQFVQLGSVALAASQLGWLVLILYLPGGIVQAFEPARRRFVQWVAVRHRLAFDATELGMKAPLEKRDDRTEVLSLDLRYQRPKQAATGIENVIHAPLLEATDLSKAFGGVVAVSEVSLEVEKGEIVGLIGPNGAGKTTTFEILSGFTRPDQGRVFFNGTDVSRFSPEKRCQLGMIRSFQDAGLFPTLTVTQSLQLAFERTLPTRFVPSVLGFSRGDQRRSKSVDELIGFMGLGAYRSKQIQELSTGTRRITELACLVALSPSLLLLDEPSSGVAQRETEALGQLLRRLKEDFDLTMFVIEHDIPLIMGLADRIIAMDVGSVIANDTPETVQMDRRVIESYLGTNQTAIQRSAGAL